MTREQYGVSATFAAGLDQVAHAAAPSVLAAHDDDVAVAASAVHAGRQAGEQQHDQAEEHVEELHSAFGDGRLLR